jgi:hypothetical protein
MLPDITSQKVAIPAALFLALSPGVVLTTNGRNLGFMNGRTSNSAVFFHALVFFLIYSLIAKALGIVLTKTDLIVTTTLFLALSPGMLLTIPPGSGGLLRSGQTSVSASITHAVVFAIVFALLRRSFPSYY